MVSSPKQLKDWINNMAKKNNLVANTVLQNFMMERLLERISVSKYKDNIILKGGFLIAAMVGIDMRSTMDMDTTIKGLIVNREVMESVLNEILSIDINDNVMFKLKGIKNIRDISEYEDFRATIEASFFTMKVNMKLDITTGDIIIPKEVDYSFKLMFEDREISIKAYNINTILSEKIESILSRNIANTRARDFYDVYVLLTLRKDDLNKTEIKDAVWKKAEERNSTIYIKDYQKYLEDIINSKDVLSIWNTYKEKYPYAEDIDLNEIIKTIREVLK